VRRCGASPPVPAIFTEGVTEGQREDEHDRDQGDREPEASRNSEVMRDRRGGLVTAVSDSRTGFSGRGALTGADGDASRAGCSPVPERVDHVP
jgi:hypothetical protein